MEHVVSSSSVFRTGALAVIALVTVGACRTERVEPTACVPGTVRDNWVDRRTPATAASDTTPAALSLTVTTPSDSLDRLPAGSTISLLIAGPNAAERPDTVRLLAAEVPDGPLWGGTDLRPGTYSASLTADGFAAGPHEFTLAPGERLQLEATLGRTCEASTK